MPVHFSVAVERVGEIVVLAVQGEADLATVPDFAAHLWRAVDAGERRILIDLGETRFIDSKTVEVLLAAAARVRRQEGLMAIACEGESICRVLELCGVKRMLPVCESREQALAELGG
jgi:anti-anti-sigma factor